MNRQIYVNQDPFECYNDDDGDQVLVISQSNLCKSTPILSPQPERAGPWLIQTTPHTATATAQLTENTKKEVTPSTSWSSSRSSLLTSPRRRPTTSTLSAFLKTAGGDLFWLPSRSSQSWTESASSPQSLLSLSRRIASQANIDPPLSCDDIEEDYISSSLTVSGLFSEEITTTSLGENSDYRSSTPQPLFEPPRQKNQKMSLLDRVYAIQQQRRRQQQHDMATWLC